MIGSGVSVAHSCVVYPNHDGQTFENAVQIRPLIKGENDVPSIELFIIQGPELPHGISFVCHP